MSFASTTIFFLSAKQVMSAIGPQRTSLVAPHMSAFGGKADIGLGCMVESTEKWH